MSVAVEPRTRVLLRNARRLGDVPTACAGCRERGFVGGPPKQHPIVVANIYQDGRWVRTEIWHLDCYGRAGSPYGKPKDAYVQGKAGWNRIK